MKKIILIVSLVLSVFANGNQSIKVNVNGEPLTSFAFALFLKQSNLKPNDFWNLKKEKQFNILHKIINKELLIEQSKKDNIRNTKEYKTKLKKLKKGAKIDIDVDIENELGLQLWKVQKFKKIDISKRIIKNFYLNNKLKFNNPEMVHARHILLKNEKDAYAIINELKKAKDIKNTFIKLAKQKSTGPSSKVGGDLGFFHKKHMVANFSKVAFSLPIGSFSKEPVKTQFGYHVIYIEEKRKANSSTLETESIKIENFLKRQKLNMMLDDLISQLKAQATIEYIKFTKFSKLLTFSYNNKNVHISYVLEVDDNIVKNSIDKKDLEKNMKLYIKKLHNKNNIKILPNSSNPMAGINLLLAHNIKESMKENKKIKNIFITNIYTK